MLMSFVSYAKLDSEVVKDGPHQNPAKRRHVTIGYKHHDSDARKRTFLFCMALDQNVKEHNKEEGLQAHTHIKTLNILTMPCHLRSHQVLTLLEN